MDDLNSEGGINPISNFGPRREFGRTIADFGFDLGRALKCKGHRARFNGHSACSLAQGAEPVRRPMRLTLGSLLCRVVADQGLRYFQGGIRQ
jgi:hypothetical protein